MTLRNGADGWARELPPIVRLDDYGMERLLRGCNCCDREGEPASSKRVTEWKQLVQVSACLCVNDVVKSSRTEELQLLIEGAAARLWTNRHAQFHSGEHFLQVRQQVTGHIHSYFMENSALEPMIAFEKFTVYIEELDMELEQNLHIVTQGCPNPNEYRVQKFIVDENEESLEMYARMTTVFGMAAFQRLPARIEAWALLSGKRYVWEPDDSYWMESLDYMGLAKSLLLSPPLLEPCHSAMSII